MYSIADLYGEIGGNFEFLITKKYSFLMHVIIKN